MTFDELMKLPHDSAWDDGRTGFVLARFDAVVDATRKLRAEVTWEDDDGPKESRTYFDPELLLEVNYPDKEGYVTLDGKVIELTEEEAAAIVANPPQELLKKYAKVYQELMRDA